MENDAGFQYRLYEAERTLQAGAIVRVQDRIAAVIHPMESGTYGFVRLFPSIWEGSLCH